MTTNRALGTKWIALILLSAVLSLFAQSELRADGVTFESGPADNIKLVIDKATIGDVLQALHEKYGIEVAGALDAGSNEPISMTVQGPLPDILQRLLRNQNYMIIRSKRNPTGVEKILITNSDHSKAPKNVAAPPPPPAPAMP